MLEEQKAKVSPKDFFLWTGAMITLYAGVVSFIMLLFNYINYTFQDPLQYYVNPYSSGMPYQMASLIILAPLFLVLMRIIRKSIAIDATRAEIWVRRWALYLIVFVAGATIIIDLIVLLTTFLGGEALTVAFLLKVLVVLMVAGAGFLHFISDVRGYWQRNPDRAKLINYGVGLLVIVTILAGFFIVGTPRDARLARYDEQKVSHLSSIQFQITNFWQAKERLPKTISEIEDPLVGFIAPNDPQTDEAYIYKVTGAQTFELCANFNAESIGDSRSLARLEFGFTDENWEHGVGEKCFERTIDPDRFPQLKPSPIR